MPVGELADPLAPAAPLEVPELDPVPDPEVDPVPEPMLLLPEVEPPELVSEPVPLEPDVEPEARPVPLLDVLPLPLMPLVPVLPVAPLDVLEPLVVSVWHAVINPAAATAARED